MVIAYATQGGLGMPDRDYYLRDDAKSKALLAKYRAHVARMLGLVGQKNADAQASWVLDLETQLAKASLDRVALREPENSYHIYTVKDADDEDAALSRGRRSTRRSAMRTSSVFRWRSRNSSPPLTTRSPACRSRTGRRICAGIW